MKRVLLALLLTACAAPDPERAFVEDALRRYDRALAEAYLTGSPQGLEAVSGEHETQRVGVLVDLVKERGEVLLASLEELRLDELTVKGSAATALVHERWSYERVDEKTRATVSPAQRREFLLRYQLERRGQGWVVSSVEHAAPSTQVPQ